MENFQTKFLMSKLIPLPNFYKKSEQAKRKMVDKKTKKKEKEIPPMPSPTLIDSSKPRTFATVATIGNNLSKQVKDETDEAKKLSILKSGIFDAVKKFISITFEKAEVNDLITNHAEFQHLQFFDPTAIFRQDLDSLQAAKVLSMIDNLQKTVVNLSEKNSSVSVANQVLLAKLDKVIKFICSRLSKIL